MVCFNGGSILGSVLTQLEFKYEILECFELIVVKLFPFYNMQCWEYQVYLLS